MANTVINIENIQGQWNAEVEIGRMNVRRKRFRSESLKEALAIVMEEYEAYERDIAPRPIFSGSGETDQPPSSVSSSAAVLSPDPAAPQPAPLDPENNDPKLPHIGRGRHRNSCECPKCVAKRAAADTSQALVEDIEQVIEATTIAAE